ncbi:MAG: HD domain-containing protein [Synergistaceae bacterium]|jgi:(p)ppGpp synthase/HD superfamily hydrolase|nr:HD domain-containing protein [Synergistaceae bacterium]
MPDGGSIHAAIDFAVSFHRGQLRKDRRTPYILHPLNVGRLLLESDLPEEYAIAGILHDTLEDTDAAPGDIEELFGAEVLALVLAASEKDRAAPWKDRKLATLHELSLAETRCLYVPCADKLDNMYTSQNQIHLHGMSFWMRFGAPAGEQMWYYSSLADLFLRRLGDSPCRHLARELARVVRINFAGVLDE